MTVKTHSANFKHELLKMTNTIYHISAYMVDSEHGNSERCAYANIIYVPANKHINLTDLLSTKVNDTGTSILKKFMDDLNLQKLSGVAILCTLEVVDEYRGKGMGGIMMNNIMNIIPSLGVNAIYLHPYPFDSDEEDFKTDLQRLKVFYGRYGFQYYDEKYMIKEVTCK